jgi:guanosine-3',5'-bis(diphosphate) 3'-pyrophosphohydrolase
MLKNQTLGAEAKLMKALSFAAKKHRRQRRKDSEGTPYINHPIDVTAALTQIAGITDVLILQAALLHDTIEDTDTTPVELSEHFGQEVYSIVQELTDDKALPKAERKRLQIKHACCLSPAAKLIKIADKICNLKDITIAEPPDWPLNRKQDYTVWAEAVVAGCRGSNQSLEAYFDRVVKQKREEFGMQFPRA